MPTTTPPGAPIIGRDTELASLGTALDGAARGQAGTVLLTGESGVGKTRLTQHLAAEARARGFAVAEGRAFAVESGLPYAVIGDALLPLLRRLEPAALTVLTRGAAGDLAAVLPGLFASAPARDTGDPAEAKARMFWSVTELLGRLAARQPLLIILDNLQWADASSLELLHFVVRQAHGASPQPRHLIVATYTDTDDDRSGALREMERSLTELGAARLLPVAPLTRELVTELVCRRFGASAATVRDFATTLHGWTRGNAFFVEETLASLVESGQLQRQGTTWQGWDVRALTAPRSVREVVLARVARLGGDARAVLDLSAALGARVALPVLRATTELGDAALADALDALVRAALLAPQPGAPPSWDFTHPLVRDTVYHALGPLRAGPLHDRIASALEVLYGARAVEHAAEIAHHLVNGTERGNGARAARYLTEAGRQALARHADRAALEYLEAALAHDGRASAPDAAPDPLPVGSLLELLAHARQRVGDFDGSVALWRQVRADAERLGEWRAVAGAERRMGLMASAEGEPRRAVAHFDAGLEALGRDADSPLAIRLLLARATARQSLGQHDEALADASAAMEMAGTVGDTGLLARVHRALLLLYVWTGPTSTARAHGAQAVALAAACGERSVEWSAHWAMAVHAGLTGDGPATAHHLAEAQRLADEVRSPVLRLWTADVALEYLAGIGQWAEALALSAEVIPAARALGQRTLLPRLLAWTALVHRAMGELERARELAEEAWREAGGGSGAEEGARGAVDVHALVPAYTAMAGCLMASGENARALAIGEAGLAIADSAGHVAWAIYRLLPFVIESALYLGDNTRAARHNDRLRRDSEALGHPLGIAWADTTDALLVYLGGDAARAVPMLRAAAARLEEVPFVFEAAKLRRLVARALLDAGDPGGSAAELRKAHEIFARLGAARELRLTREQLRGIGARPPAAVAGAEGAGALSAREVEIARLVAARRSNKEIGTALDISPRTVSTHLSNIFVKLGVGTRGELTDLVRGGKLGE